MFLSKLYLHCDATNCAAELLLTPLLNNLATLEAEAVANGWFVDTRTAAHFCPQHRPDGKPQKPRP